MNVNSSLPIQLVTVVKRRIEIVFRCRAFSSGEMNLVLCLILNSVSSFSPEKFQGSGFGEDVPYSRLIEDFALLDFSPLDLLSIDICTRLEGFHRLRPFAFHAMLPSELHSEVVRFLKDMTLTGLEQSIRTWLEIRYWVFPRTIKEVRIFD